MPSRVGLHPSTPPTHSRSLSLVLEGGRHCSWGKLLTPCSTHCSEWSRLGGVVGFWTPPQCGPRCLHAFPCRTTPLHPPTHSRSLSLVLEVGRHCSWGKLLIPHITHYGGVGWGGKWGFGRLPGVDLGVCSPSRVGLHPSTPPTHSRSLSLVLEGGRHCSWGKLLTPHSANYGGVD